MQSTVQKWGNSLAVRIPNAFAKDIHLKQGSSIEIESSHNEIVIKPVQQKRFELKSMLEKINKNNLHEETQTGMAVGNEIW